MNANRSGDSLELLVVAARQIQESGSSSDDVLREIVDIAVATLDGCDFAGITTEREGRVQSPVVSNPKVLAIDALQYQIDVGPCLLAMRGPDPLVDAPDLESDLRFVPFGKEAAKNDCRAVLAHRLFVDTQTLGSLNLYSRSKDSFTHDDRRRAALLSSLASMSLNVLRLETDGEGLREAVQSRDVIGQAKGILMERENIDADTAFGRLRDQSQRDNVKLREARGTSRPDPRA